MATLYLNLKREFFDAILSGVKKREYRQAIPHWRRLLSKQYDKVLFRNGYAKDGPKATFVLERIERDFRHGLYILHIGERVE